MRDSFDSNREDRFCRMNLLEAQARMARVLAEQTVRGPHLSLHSCR